MEDRILFKHFLLGIHYVKACEEISASGSEATLTCHMGCDHKDVGEYITLKSIVVCIASKSFLDVLLDVKKILYYKK